MKFLNTKSHRPGHPHWIQWHLSTIYGLKMKVVLFLHSRALVFLTTVWPVNILPWSVCCKCTSAGKLAPLEFQSIMKAVKAQEKTTTLKPAAKINITNGFNHKWIKLPSRQGTMKLFTIQILYLLRLSATDYSRKPQNNPVVTVNLRAMGAKCWYLFWFGFTFVKSFTPGEAISVVQHHFLGMQTPSL